MEIEVSPNAGNGGIRLSSWASNKPGSDRRLAPTQSFNELADMRIALSQDTRAESVAVLNQILVDTMTMRDLYKKHHWQTSGPSFYELHLVFDKHYDEQAELIDAIAERVQILGGISIAMAADVAEMTTLERPSRDRETPSVQLARLIEAHERVLYGARTAARRATEVGDDGTNDLLVSDVIRTNEKQAWFVQEQAQRDYVPR